MKVGALCAGYGGLELALRSVFGDAVEPAWFCEFDKAPSKILAHHWPTVHNYGDLTKMDWATVPKVDVLTAGFPCQPFSHAGKRLGANDERHLWPYIAEGIRVLRPRLVLLENVRGLLSGQGEPDTDEVTALDRRDKQLKAAIARAKTNRSTRVRALTLRLTERRRRVVDALRRARARLIRAIGAVLRDLANIGYDARYYGLRAADVGAAHGRFRVFIFAVPADSDDAGLQGFADSARAAQAGRHGHPVSGAGGPDLTLLPTPAVNDMGAAYTPETWDAWTARIGRGRPRRAPVSGDRSSELLLPGVAKDLAGQLLPTPRATDGTKGGPNQRGSSGDLMLPSACAEPTRADVFAGIYCACERRGQDWREYEAAIRRQEATFGRPAPLPTEPGKNGQPRLSPRFVEWLMALPDGWVTDVPDISRNDMLKALGNGVVPPQAAAALRAFLADTSKERVA